MGFKSNYTKLNQEQKNAVDTIDGPLLVLAGPGTGKTEILAARVANILNKTDTLPQNILCLTFTDSASINMRERLGDMIGEASYDVNIDTYHSFSSEIIRTYPEYFESINVTTNQDTSLETPINELGQIQIISQIINSLPFTDPMRTAKHYLKSVLGTISDFKKAKLYPKDIENLSKQNIACSKNLSPKINDAMSSFTRMPRKPFDAQNIFGSLLEIISHDSSDIAKNASDMLAVALLDSETENSTKPITKWKNAWLQKNQEDNWIFGDPANYEKLLSVSRIYESYQSQLKNNNLYDFNDMILTTIEALKSKPKLRFNLQERYQYILLDEFQDTNASQFELMKLLSDHPVHEGKPNIMAVGDDDQGIYAFQGADIGNMVEFINSYKDVKIINLIKNYRSHHDILHTAHNIAKQIGSRLHNNLENVSKDIVAASDSLPKNAYIARHEFNNQAAEFGWIADNIAKQIKKGTNPSQIAVLAPKHSILEKLVPFLNSKGIPVSYERRENVFDTPIIQSYLLIIRFIIAAKDNNQPLMDELLPKVLSLEFWNIPVEIIWQINWERRTSNEEILKPWAKIALDNESTKDQVKFLLSIAAKAQTLGLEDLLDYITGSSTLELDNFSYTSPLKEYYFSESNADSSALKFYESVSHLSVIRSNLRDMQLKEDRQLIIEDFINLYVAYEEAEQPLINTHPISQAESAVQLQTVYKAKGLEYEYVYLPFMHDDVWGSSSRGSANKITLPYNLRHIRSDSSGDDNLRRLLFVAITRAKIGLVVTSHANKDTGKKTLPTKFLQEIKEGETRQSEIFPAQLNKVIQTERPKEQLNIDIEMYWHTRHQLLSPELGDLLRLRLNSYIMSPTHLNNFTNVEYGGPQDFLLNTLLRFPKAPTPDSSYGNALHKSLEKYQKDGQNNLNPKISDAVNSFNMHLSRANLGKNDVIIYKERGKIAIETYLRINGDRLKEPAEIEADFRKEGVTLNGARLTGKLDRLEINKNSKTVRIIDFKSGTPSTKWGTTSKYLNYKQQLYFYILLIKESSTYKNYSVESAALEFLEPLPNGFAAPPLELVFNENEYEEFKKLIEKVWDLIMKLELPDISSYAISAKGMKDFISDLINNRLGV